MIATKPDLLQFFKKTRSHSESICEPLQIEDYVVQPIVDVSPPKWHLGHTTWFFEEFILKPHKKEYKLFSEDFAFVFNSYYESVGKRVVRTDRGNLSRPTVKEVYSYRNYVTEQLSELLNEEVSEEIEGLVEIGIHHEKQHQELLLTDIKYILGNNPLTPAYRDDFQESTIESQKPQWIEIPEGIYTIGHRGDGFAYDNEFGRHKVFLQKFAIANRFVTNGNYLEFIEAGGYENVMLWHAEGWEWVQTHDISKPLYWHKTETGWQHYTMQGLNSLDPDAPLAHISYYEAFAYAQWKGLRLPTEFEWEVAQEHFSWGQRWEWTESAYLPYPGYTKVDGALGEYNGKFMVSQKTLRGGSVATSEKHTRPTYRNFFHPQLRWQFTGLRLAKTL
ncbi:ergothioneine biosynthesis protein EgtB [Flavimarina sp. Hel_I_48]|uniref:ergothioneine biosynthesis protein EgtB n=1 Tax=Flavimarina sp. Hel_I_48 TaxID=1392488 RepID=UPI0004DED9E9|nr:ergothioneine biosynthesis protein EgtB [Flavimarina sp. Hel_I_48]